VAAAVVDAWQGWAPTGPGELAASLLITASADPDQAPAVHVFGAMLAGEAGTQEVLDGLVAGVGSDPSATSSRHGPFREAKHRLVQLGLGDERPGALPYSKSEYYREPLPPEAIASLLDGFMSERVAGESRELDFTPWGGAYNDPPAGATAFPHRSELFLLKQTAVLAGGASSEQRERARRWLTESWEAVHPWGAGGAYPNFPDPELADEAAAYYTTNGERLADVKARYDPGGLFGG
jgi:hypothetical protein